MWIEFPRITDSPARDYVGKLLDGQIAVCDAVRVVVLAGARNERHLSSLRRPLAPAVAVPTEPLDYEEAAALHRLRRSRGETVRKLMDRLIAAIAMRTGASVFHFGSDLNVFAPPCATSHCRFLSDHRLPCQLAFNSRPSPPPAKSQGIPAPLKSRSNRHSSNSGPRQDADRWHRSGIA